MGESGQDKKRLGVPSWQLKSPTGEAQPSDQNQNTTTDEEESRETTLEKAKKFLLEDEVRNASLEKKISFLESKGLKSEEINDLLESETEEASSPPPSIPASTSQVPSTSAPPVPSSPTASNTPPIITYPEFLTTSPHPAPLITTSRLLSTLYLFGGLSTILYGTSTYLVKPMVATLTEARHELAGVAQTNLDKLVAKLRETVSEIPQDSLDFSERYKDEAEEDSDGDPTELFHRDIGVQTSLPASATDSRPASPNPPFTSLLDEQTSRLSVLNTHITELLEDSTSEGHDSEEVTTTINVLKEYLDGLMYTPPSSVSYGGVYGGSSDTKSGEENDEIANLKAQIRGVKGVLLSARSFPGGPGRVR